MAWYFAIANVIKETEVKLILDLVLLFCFYAPSKSSFVTQKFLGGPHSSLEVHSNEKSGCCSGNEKGFIFFHLTNFSPVPHFYTPLKMSHWTKVG